MSINKKILILLLVYLTHQFAKSNELKEANMKVYCNEYVPYGIQTNVLITMEKLPVNCTITVHLSTPSYLLAFFEIGNVTKVMPPKFKKTLSISRKLSYFGIKTKVKPVYEKGYFANLTASFWTISDENLRLFGRMKPTPLLYEIEEIVPINVYLIEHCSPRLTMPKCSNPRSPRKILVSRELFITGLFLENCNLTTRTTYNWRLKDAIGLTQFASYNTHSPVLDIRPFTLRFPTSYELWRNLYVFEVEGNLNGLNFSARCYLKLVMGQVEAVILGGKTRRAQQSEILWMNGSTSYDFSKRSKEIQFSYYNWNCYSFDDSRNPFCHQNISSVAEFSIPANSLKTGCRYIFRLQVSRDDNPNISSQTEQIIKMINYNILEIMIECVKNCRMDFFIPNSKVHLDSICTNCGNQNVRYQWFIDGQLVLTSKELVMDLRTSLNEIRVKLLISSEDGRYGRKSKTLVKNLSPTGGTCSVNPKEGYEALTPFYPCCRNFVSLNNPIEYWYYAGPVLLNSCLDCNCEVYLPVTDFIKVLVCDVFWSCHTSWIKVKVNALNKVPHKVQSLLEEGPLHRYLQTIQSLASHLTNADSGTLLLNNFTSIHPQSWSSLARLVNLSLTLAHRLYPVDQKTKALLSMVAMNINNNLQEIHLNDNISFLTEKPFIDISLACLKIYEMMKRLHKMTYQPPWSIYNQQIDLIERSVQTLGIGKTIFPWVIFNSTSETERLQRSFRHFQRNQFQLNPGYRKEEVVVEVQCFDKFPKKNIIVRTRDKIQVVTFTPGVFEEVLRKNHGHGCLKVVSIKQKLNWWYPLEKQPSALVVSVRIYEKEDNFTVQVPLNKTKISFKTKVTYHAEPIVLNQSRKKRSDHISHAGIYVNCMKTGTIWTLHEVRMYRIMLMEHSLLAVHFTKTTHDLQIVLKTRYKPLFHEIETSTCLIPALDKIKVLLMRNNCHSGRRAYIAIRIASNISVKHSPNTPIADGPATFSFSFQIRSCDVWPYSFPPDKQKWLHFGCYPTMDLSCKKGIRCTCDILGTYTNHLYYIPPIEVPVGVYTEPHLNVKIVIFYAITLVFILLWILLFYLYRNVLPSRTVLYQNFETEDETTGELHDLTVCLKVGGRLNSGTTASVTLLLYSPFETQRKITILQDPEHIILKQNITLNICIRTRDIRIPTKVLVYHNNAGRFSSWYLRRIEVTDVQAGETQVFMVNKWIQNNMFLLSSSLIYRSGDVRFLDSWKTRFKAHFELLWINYSLWQPVTGNWRESPRFPRMSRAKRFCVFISKLLVSYTLCATYFGLTTTQSLQLLRSKFLNYKDLVILTIVSWLVDLILQILFTVVSLKCG